MTPDEYIKLCLRTEPDYDFESVGRITPGMQHAVDGMVTEVGELVDAFKRHKFYKKELDKVNVVEEMGDVCWYLSIMLKELGVSWEQMWEWNIMKLQKRFPDKFSEDKALNRDLDSERKVLEENVKTDPGNDLDVLTKPDKIDEVKGEDRLEEIKKNLPGTFRSETKITDSKIINHYHEYPTLKNGQVVGYIYGRCR
jgi:NTP pyrophosphatase (non-canonical NTP hydrolase)